MSSTCSSSSSFPLIESKCVILGHTGVGKCWSAGTQFRLANGETKKVEQLSEEDELIHPNGASAKIQRGSITKGNTREDGNGAATYKVTFKDEGRQEWSCNNQHILVLLFPLHPSNIESKRNDCSGSTYYSYTTLIRQHGDGENEDDHDDLVILREFTFASLEEAIVSHRHASTLSRSSSSSLTESESLPSSSNSPMTLSQTLSPNSESEYFCWEGSVDSFLRMSPDARSLARMCAPRYLTLQQRPKRTFAERMENILRRTPTEEEIQQCGYQLGRRLVQEYDTLSGDLDSFPFGSLSLELLNGYHRESIGLSQFLSESISLRQAILIGATHNQPRHDNNSIRLHTNDCRILNDLLAIARSVGCTTGKIEDAHDMNHFTNFSCQIHLPNELIRTLPLPPFPLPIPSSIVSFPSSPSSSTFSSLNFHFIPFTLTRVDHGDYYGFTLEGSNGRCLLADNMITHNTSMLNQFVRGHCPAHTTATIGAAFMRKTIKITRDGQSYQVVLQIWDTAGQERFRSMTPMYYRGAQAAILVYDVTQPSSLEKVHTWVEELNAHTENELRNEQNMSQDWNNDIILVVAGNKSDLLVEGVDSLDRRSVTAYADSIGAALFETSAKTGNGIEALFENVAKQLLDRHLQANRSKEMEFKAKGGGSSNRANLHTKLNHTNGQDGCCS